MQKASAGELPKFLLFIITFYWIILMEFANYILNLKRSSLYFSNSELKVTFL